MRVVCHLNALPHGTRVPQCKTFLAGSVFGASSPLCMLYGGLPARRLFRQAPLWRPGSISTAATFAPYRCPHTAEKRRRQEEGDWFDAQNALRGGSTHPSILAGRRSTMCRRGLFCRRERFFFVSPPRGSKPGHLGATSTTRAETTVGCDRRKAIANNAPSPDVLALVRLCLALARRLISRRRQAQAFSAINLFC